MMMMMMVMVMIIVMMFTVPDKSTRRQTSAKTDTLILEQTFLNRAKV